MNLQEQSPHWYAFLRDRLSQQALHKIASMSDKIADLEKKKMLRPAMADVWNAYKSTPPFKVQVVIVGQDPYPNNEAHGLCFSSCLSTVPPSLKVIFKELERNYGVLRTNPNLQDWADQGVLMLNTILTTTYRVPGAHKGWGWEEITKETLRILSGFDKKIVFMGWGAFAHNLLDETVDESKHVVLKACHPQAQNYNPTKNKFVGCNHFVTANEHITDTIKWV